MRDRWGVDNGGAGSMWKFSPDCVHLLSTMRSNPSAKMEEEEEKLAKWDKGRCLGWWESDQNTEVTEGPATPDLRIGR